MSSPSLLTTINDLILRPEYHDYLSILKGARNGFVYGVKIRFPHALIMSVLFGRGDVQSRIKQIFKATRTHALNLAKFVTIYKTLLLLQRKLNDDKERSADTFIAGLIGGYIVFGERTAINEQIVLYVASRVLASFIPRSFPSKNPPGINGTNKPIPPNAKLFTVFASLTWALVMWLFRHREETINPGMWSSMKYLYLDSNSWDGLKTLLWHNK
ncbi:Tim17/Tim22/Tim23/Pmp24 family-domain-containing protein [Cantharellus anzutake]|uniref:Tim17/Tim22/Tim23/Pmp24 family-domain-containing protein n=1 Tax=Cantharellus anzutake TaxID=1750568 RepID=UPI0019063FE9|nr:Tim17/Tim22/Tim23/Pmp24 family-domain-containing protein [Cantharellus anzutake]KAF8343802.1 Tim17/Tim22/Tim23/Pmp24 family-domain-containing protein [Cantharellus anzutake]